MESVGLMNIEGQLTETYNGSTVLITGHTGFKGSWLTLWLESLGARVIGFSLDPPSRPSYFDLANLSSRIVDIRGDILDRNKLSQVITKFRPEFIFHLAAQPLVRASYIHPHETFNVNIMGTVNVLESIRLSKNSAICVCITSDKCYDNKEWDYAYRENDPMGGYDPYSASKGAAELIIASYRNSFFNKSGSKSFCALSSARAGNVIGGGDWAEDRIVPDCVRSIVKGETIKIRSRCAIRPWQFVLDPLYGYLLLALKMKEMPEKYSDAWNFGPYYSNIVDVQTMVTKIIEEWEGGSWISIMQDEHAFHEAGYLKLDIAKSVTTLGWRPIYSLEEAIRETIGWYKNYYSGSTDVNTFSLEQINNFMQSVGKSL
jgi:CDP-glucose 4,6-dehydratase